MDNEESISKKRLLAATGISYGQFYRWKRMGLIPEQWFERRSTFTGHETFLPRGKVLDRIEQIKALKDGRSLEQIAELLAAGPAPEAYTGEQVSSLDWLSDQARQVYEPLRSGGGDYAFGEVVCVAVIDKLLEDGRLSRDQIRLAISAMIKVQESWGADTDDLNLIVASRFGVTVAAVHEGKCTFDPQSEVIADVSIGPITEQCRLKLSGIAETRT